MGPASEVAGALGSSMAGLDPQARCLTRACSRQAGGARASAWAAPTLSALWNEGLCGRNHDGLQLMRIPLGRCSEMVYTP
jgi:hypothetical protein